jgi:hypothetical protein
LASLIDNKTLAGSIVLNNYIYIFGGSKYSKGIKNLSNTWERYSIK